MVKKYIYGGKEYFSISLLRQAIWNKDRKIFGMPKMRDEWLSLGVEVQESDDDKTTELVYPDIEDQKKVKLSALDGAFLEYRNSKDAFLISSLGFKVNANVVAFDNVTGLVARLEYAKSQGNANEKVEFMDFDDILRDLSLEDLKILQVEISVSGSNCYSQKWKLREQIQNAQTEQELKAIEITFSSSDFSLGGN